MSATLRTTVATGLAPMIRIECRRFARSPFFLVGAVLAYVITALNAMNGEEHVSDVLAWPIVPAFLIGLPSLVVAARLVRSTDAADEALGTTPGSEARRTLAVAGAAVVPFLAGCLWLLEVGVIVAVKPPHENELWFATVGGLQTASILVALGPVACLGGALLGVLVGRWLRFRGAAAVAVVVLVAVDMLGQASLMGEDIASAFAGDSAGARARLWVTWAMWHSGAIEDGTSALGPGNAPLYLLYLVVLCAIAVGGAVWHDRTVRTRSFASVLAALLGLAVVLFVLAATTGPDGVLSEPIPFLVTQ